MQVHKCLAAWCLADPEKSLTPGLEEVASVDRFTDGLEAEVGWALADLTGGPGLTR